MASHTGRTAPPLKGPVEQADELAQERAARSYTHAVEVTDKARGEGGDNRIYLARRLPNGEWGHLKIIPADTFDLDEVTGEYGGGHYRMQIRGVLPDGRKGWVDSAVFDIDAPQKAVGDDGKAVAVAPPNPMADVTRMLLDSANARADDMRALVTSLIGALGGGQQRSDPLEVVKLAREIASVGTAPQGIPPEKYITDRAQSYDAGFEKGVDIGTREGRRGDADPGWAGVVRELALPALETIKAVSGAPAQPPQARIAPPPAGAALPPAPVVAEVHTVNEPVWFTGLKPWLPMIGFAAQNKMAPANAAGLVMDQIPDESYNAFVDDVLGPDFAARVTPLLPVALVQRFPEWVSQTLAAIRAAVEEEQADAGPVGLGEGDEPVGGEPEAGDDSPV